jgi:hypothetical protein
MAADCTDGSGCTTDVCTGGVCGNDPIPGCVPCTMASDCDDADECTTETCTGGVCGHEDVPDCPVMFERCSDGVDNDDDTSVDCADTDCQDDPACQEPLPAEVCGDCVDNDGDGMVDYEDSDCCADPSTLTLRRLVMKPPSGKKGNRLRLRVRDAGMPMDGFSATAGDTSIQIADADGQVFCQTIAKGNWKQRKRVFRFRDRKAAFAGGLKKGAFKVKRNGQIVFRTNGKKVVLRASHGGPVRVTLRVGSHCAQSTASLRPKRKSLVFP